MRYSFLVRVGLGALLSGCHIVGDIVAPADIKLPPIVFSWLPDQDGQTLVFRDGAGNSQSLRVTREQGIKQVATSKVSPITRGSETLYLAYRGLLAQPGGFSVTTSAYSEIAALYPTLVFYGTDVPVYANGLIPSGVLLAATLSPVTASAVPAQALQATTTLGLRTYPAVLHLDSLATKQGLTAPAALQELFFARDAGLVAFKTKDGQLWLRQ